MRKTTKLLSALMMVAALMTACQVESLEKLDTVRTVKFSAGEAEATRTVFASSGTGTKLPVLWTSNQDVRIFPSQFSSAINAGVVPSSDKKTASFTGDMAFSSTARSAFYLLSPASVFSRYVSDKIVEINLPSSQTPTATSVDENAQVLVASTPVYRPVPETVTLNPTHLTAYIALRLTDFTAAGKNPTVEVTSASAVLSGKAQYSYADGSLTPDSESSSKKVSAPVLSASKPVFLACLPAQVAGTKMLIRVKGLSGTLNKEITIPSDKNLTSGTVAVLTVSMAQTIPVTGVSVSPTTLSLETGQTGNLTATVSPSNATNKSVTWSSSNTNVATVSTSGVVTAKAAGTATITATTADGGKTATCAVTVTAATVPVTGVSVTPTTLTLEAGLTGTLYATVTPSNATDKSVTWSSSNTNVATVSSSGVVTAKAAGTATITVTTKDGGKTATCALTVTPATVLPSSVSVSPTTLTLLVDKTSTLSATVLPTDATDKTVAWSSADPTIAVVSTSGVVTARKAGKTTIKATTVNGLSAVCSLTVKKRPTKVEIDAKENDFRFDLDERVYNIAKGMNLTLTYTVTYSDGTTSFCSGAEAFRKQGWGIEVTNSNSGIGLRCHTAGTTNNILRVECLDDRNVYDEMLISTWDAATSIKITQSKGLPGWVKTGEYVFLYYEVQPSTACQKILVRSFSYTGDEWTRLQTNESTVRLNAPSISNNYSNASRFKNSKADLTITTAAGDLFVGKEYRVTNMDLYDPKPLDYICYNSTTEKYMFLDGGARIWWDKAPDNTVYCENPTLSVPSGYSVVGIVTKNYKYEPTGWQQTSSYPKVESSEGRSLTTGQFHGFAIALKNCRSSCKWSSDHDPVDRNENWQSYIGHTALSDSQNWNGYGLIVAAYVYNEWRGDSHDIQPVFQIQDYAAAVQPLKNYYASIPTIDKGFYASPWFIPTVANFEQLCNSSGSFYGSTALSYYNARIENAGGTKITSSDVFWTINTDSSNDNAYTMKSTGRSTLNKASTAQVRPFLLF